MEEPLVSIICISHNHNAFIAEALQSVRDQSYKNIELVLVDDHSADGSREFIIAYATEHPDTKIKILESGSGICKAFNAGFGMSSGEFIIDLSADDVLDPNRVKEGIKAFQARGENYGINFTDAAYIDEEGKFLRNHYHGNMKAKVMETITGGYLYPLLLSKYIICTPTMMMRRKVFENIGGYDESLAYEDFDFWIRTSKQFKYCYTDEVLVKKRLVKNSLSGRQYEKNSLMLKSTLEVCKKAEKINSEEAERLALLKRMRYECRKALLSGNHAVAGEFLLMMERNRMGIVEYSFFRIWVYLASRM